MTPRIVVAGSSNTDMILQLDRIPRPGETLLGGQFTMAAGGKGANQAVAAAKAGGDVTFLARTGNDLFGKQAIAGFAREGIHIEYVIQDDDAASGVALIFVANDGENSIGVASGANSRLSVTDMEAARSCIESAAAVIMQLESPLETVHRAALIATEAKVLFILNPAPAQPLSDELLSRVSILTPNEIEAEFLTGIPVTNSQSAADAATALQARGVATVIITMGSQGAYVTSSDFTGVVPSFKVKAIDTTAAGDVFNGALTVALTEQMPLAEAVRFACAAAGLSVTKLGAQTSAPSRQEIESLLKTG